MNENKEHKDNLIKTQLEISYNLKEIAESLRKINETQIEHYVNVEKEHSCIIEKIKNMTEKYWWLILILIASVLLISGYENIFQYIIR